MRERSERTKLRDRFMVPAMFGVLSAAKVFWTSWVGTRYAAAVMTGVWIWWAGTNYVAYRERYPRKPRSS